MPQSEGRKPAFTVRLPASVIAQLDAIAEQRGSSRGSLMREAALYWLASQARPQRRAS